MHPARSDPPAGVAIRPVQPADLAGLAGDGPDLAHRNAFFQRLAFSTSTCRGSLFDLDRLGDPRARSNRIGCRFDRPSAFGLCLLPPGAGPPAGANRPGRGQPGGRADRALAKAWCWRPLTGSGLQGAQAVTVVTQGRNRAAQRLYQQCGFLSRDLQLWYHKWYPRSRINHQARNQKPESNGPRLFNPLQPILAPGPGTGAHLPGR